MTGGKLSGDIDAAYSATPPDGYRSSRIGASIVGNPCTAFLSLQLRGFPDTPVPPKVRRIFSEGHRIETNVVKDLRKAGYDLQDVDPFTGKQWMWERYGGHAVYYADGIIIIDGEPLLLEIKSMNDANFKKFKDKGVKISHPKYWAQMQVGMGYSGYKKCSFIAYSKNTSEYWDEVLEFNPIEFAALKAKIEDVLRGDGQRVGYDVTDWRCRECSKCEVCWGDAPVVQDMRTCANAYPVDKGWKCSLGCEPGTCMSYKRYTPKDRT